MLSKATGWNGLSWLLELRLPSRDIDMLLGSDVLDRD